MACLEVEICVCWWGGVGADWYVQTSRVGADWYVQTSRVGADWYMYVLVQSQPSKIGSDMV